MCLQHIAWNVLEKRYMRHVTSPQNAVFSVSLLILSSQSFYFATLSQICQSGAFCYGVIPQFIPIGHKMIPVQMLACVFFQSLLIKHINAFFNVTFTACHFSMYMYYQQLTTLCYQCLCCKRFGVFFLRHHQELVYTLFSLYITSISLYTLTL